MKEKFKSPFIIYTDFESILGPENKRKQNPDKTYTNKCQKHLLAVIPVYKYELMINLVDLLKHN